MEDLGREIEFNLICEDAMEILSSRVNVEKMARGGLVIDF
jgi:hypothetical protein